MSDKFEKDYKKIGGQIEPSDEFRRRLTVTLEQEQHLQDAKKNSKNRSVGIRAALLSAAACLAIAAGGLAWSGLSSDHVTVVQGDSQSSSDPTAAADVQTPLIAEHSLNAAVIGSGSWHEPGMTADECIALLSSRLKDGDDLSYLSVSDTNVFTGAEQADELQIAELAELLSSAEESAETGGGEAVYYMAVFGNGDVVKLTVRDGKYIEISDSEGAIYAEGT